MLRSCGTIQCTILSILYVPFNVHRTSIYRYHEITSITNQIIVSKIKKERQNTWFIHFAVHCRMKQHTSNNLNLDEFKMLPSRTADVVFSSFLWFSFMISVYLECWILNAIQCYIYIPLKNRSWHNFNVHYTINKQNKNEKKTKKTDQITPYCVKNVLTNADLQLPLWLVLFLASFSSFISLNNSSFFISPI